MHVEMRIKGLMLDPVTNMPIIILSDLEGQRILPIWVGFFEANAIALDSSGSILVVGNTSSPDFPLREPSLQATP